eukprot:448892_1
MPPTKRKRRRITKHKKERKQLQNAWTVMYGNDLLGIITSFLTTREYVSTLSLCSIWHYNFLSKPYNTPIIKQMLIKEFSLALINLYFQSEIKNVIYKCIHFLYNLWMDPYDWTEYDNLLYWKLALGKHPSNVNYTNNPTENPTWKHIASIFHESESVFDRMEQFPNRIETFIFWIKQIMKNCDISNINEYTMPLHEITTGRSREIHVSAITAYVLIERWPKLEKNNNIFINYTKFIKWCKNNEYKFESWYDWVIVLDRIGRQNMNIYYRYKWICIIIGCFCYYSEGLMSKLKQIQQRKQQNIGMKNLREKKMKTDLIYYLSLVYRIVIDGIHFQTCCDRQPFGAAMLTDIYCNDEKRKMQKKKLSYLKKCMRYCKIDERLRVLNKFANIHRLTLFEYINNREYARMSDRCLTELNNLCDVMQLR